MADLVNHIGKKVDQLVLQEPVLKQWRQHEELVWFVGAIGLLDHASHAHGSQEI